MPPLFALLKYEVANCVNGRHFAAATDFWLKPRCLGVSFAFRSQLSPRSFAFEERRLQNASNVLCSRQQMMQIISNNGVATHCSQEECFQLNAVL